MSLPVPASFPRKRVLLLGASGKLGRMLCAVWSNRTDHPFEIIPVFRGQLETDGGVCWAPGQSCDALPSVDVVAAFWGVTRGDRADLARNTSLAQAAERLARELGVGCVLHCSSAAVYAPGADLSERAETRPPGAYGQAKLEMEAALAAMGQGPRRVILRIGSVAGAESLFGNMRPGQSITLDRFADGQGPFRSYIAPQDLARVVEAAALSGEGVFNVASPGPVRMQDIAEAAGCPVIWKPAPDTALQHVTLNTTRLQAICPLPATDPLDLVEGARATGIWP